ncbi:hypothetical protein [Thioalkalivibrio sp. ALE23]|uniref:hypothetical protein n=1 Tax=Thioalkalivibrio sp. ALE23 TaxID=1265495 RepID=UPI0003824AE4|nr:hypothetical protein [Thioalkalivibrio sp. ALE23]
MNWDLFAFVAICILFGVVVTLLISDDDDGLPIMRTGLVLTIIFWFAVYWLSNQEIGQDRYAVLFSIADESEEIHDRVRSLFETGCWKQEDCIARWEYQKIMDDIVEEQEEESMGQAKSRLMESVRGENEHE